jgi:hypothetical protein
MFTETPRPAGLTSTGTRTNANGLRQALSRPAGGSHSGKPAVAAVAAGSLPANVRLANRGQSPAANLAGNTHASPEAAQHTPNYPAPSAVQPIEKTNSISPITLVLVGMALMCGTYLALNYFQLFR